MADETEVITPELEAERAAVLQQMGAPQSVVTGETRVFVDYFGTDQTWKVYFPDGVQYVEHKLLTEGDRRSYLDATNHDVKLNQKSGETSLKTSPGSDLHALLRAAIVDWYLVRRGEPLKFTAQNRDSIFLKEFPPKLVDLVAADVRLKNPWLSADFTLEDIDEQMKRLQEIRDQKVKEEESEANFTG